MSTGNNYWNTMHARFRAKAERASAEYDRRKKRGERVSQAAIAEKHGLTLQGLRKYRWRQKAKQVSETRNQAAELSASEPQAL